MDINDLIQAAFNIGMAQIPEEIVGLVKLVMDFGPHNVLEIGSALGGSFFLWCKLADTTGKKISIDLPGGRYGGSRFVDSDVRLKRDNAMQRWSSNVHLIAADSHSSVTQRQVSEILGDEELDFLFIDGDHSYNGVRADYEMYSPFVRRSGLIAFHDINDTAFHRSQDVDVARLWQEVPGHKREFNARQGWAGIGVITC